ncbi:MAG: linear amide C-N hydrolase [Bacteroidales bacterium]|nr:linear amide C-N hydrolase [Bacteroidales bacterium]
MKRNIRKNMLAGIASVFILITGYLLYCNSGEYYQLESNRGCATFLLSKNDTLLVCHNLDDYIEVPGAVFINKRGVRKENIGWADFTCLCAKRKSDPRLEWISSYGSVTYNTWGKDFIDGGVNEKGLYIGEMTLLGTTYTQSDKPKFHHHFFMQYVLDNFTTVHEVLENITHVGINGHCQWHYFVADKSGNTAVIEFINNIMTVYEGNNMPVQVLCNRAYEKELKMMPEEDSIYNQMLENDFSEKDLRFMLASKKINDYDEDSGAPLVEYAFSILKQMDMGNNKWSVVYDLKNLNMYFRTRKGQHIKYIDFAAFDYSCSAPVKVFDINTDTSGNVAGKFMDYSVKINKEFIGHNFDHINFGFIGNVFFKSRYKNKINRYANMFECKGTSE